MDETAKVIRVATAENGGQNLNFATPVETVVKAIASIGTNKKPILLGPIVRHEIRQFIGQTAWVNGLAFSPDGRSIVSSCYDDKTHTTLGCGKRRRDSPVGFYRHPSGWRNQGGVLTRWPLCARQRFSATKRGQVLG